jgi:aerobic carbon-monoxide dehydrogenase small subunit
MNARDDRKSGPETFEDGISGHETSPRESPDDTADRGDEAREIALTVNGVPRSAQAPPRRLLSDFLRHDLALTGTHVGCEHGVCGCCTVLLDGAPIRSCLMLAVSAAGHEITTVEGLAGPDGELSAVQRAFAECHGLQCGFCTPGFLITCTALLRECAAAGKTRLTDDEVLAGISGNLCRCTGYQNIVKAVHRAMELASAAGAGAAGPAAFDGRGRTATNSVPAGSDSDATREGC